MADVRVRVDAAVTDARRILVVVDDDDDVRRALARILSLLGYEIRAFESAEAWLADACTPDAAILDVNLPGMSGIELDERLRREGRVIPTVFITAQEDLGEAVAGRIVLQKPFETQPLLEAIERVIATVDKPSVTGDPP